MLWQMDVRRKRWDAQALFGPTGSGQQGVQEDYCTTGSALLTGSTGQMQKPAWPLLSVSLAQNFVASMGTAP